MKQLYYNAELAICGYANPSCLIIQICGGAHKFHIDSACYSNWCGSRLAVFHITNQHHIT